MAKLRLMKTIVIHPKDSTTDFLSVIYEGKDWEVIRYNPSHKGLKNAIQEHDRIITLGHGTGDGLLGFDRFVIDSRLVYLLRQKQCVCVWCYANEFVERYELKGFYTGMIISELDEAYYLGINATANEIEQSNTLFANSIKSAVNDSKTLLRAQELYNLKAHNKWNPVIEFNQCNLFEK